MMINLYNNPYFEPISLSPSICPLTQKQQAEKKFWGLGDRFWMQIIDGKFHKFGHLVFDKGLHKGVKEPGFSDSLRDGCTFAAAHLGDKLSVNFYKELHKKLCSHFNGQATNTLIIAEKTGEFRNTPIFCRVTLKTLSQEAANHYGIVEEYKCNKFYLMENEITREEYLLSKQWLAGWVLHWENKIKEINTYANQIATDLGVSKFVSLEKAKKDFQIYVHSLLTSPTELEEMAQRLFDRYSAKIEENHVKMRNAQCQNEIEQLLDEKIVAIAELFQLLEWCHFFGDGQGRTDLVLQAKLLSEEGLNPAILNEPYTSTYSLLPEWKSDLVQGINRWKAEASHHQ